MTGRYGLAFAITALVFAPVASAEPIGGPFDVVPASDAALAEAHGTGLTVPFRRNLRALSDANITAQIQQMGLTSRITMDDWWGQTGAALIFNNLLASR